MKIAQKTGGEYLHADARQFGVEQLESALANLKRTENEARVVKDYDDVYQGLLFPMFLLLVGEACMSDRRRAGRARAAGAAEATPDAKATASAKAPASAKATASAKAPASAKPGPA